jgi:hypothetical protein
MQLQLQSTVYGITGRSLTVHSLADQLQRRYHLPLAQQYQQQRPTDYRHFLSNSHDQFVNADNASSLRPTKHIIDCSHNKPCFYLQLPTTSNNPQATTLKPQSILSHHSIARLWHYSRYPFAHLALISNQSAPHAHIPTRRTVITSPCTDSRPIPSLHAPNLRPHNNSSLLHWTRVAYHTSFTLSPWGMPCLLLYNC